MIVPRETYATRSRSKANRNLSATSLSQLSSRSQKSLKASKKRLRDEITRKVRFDKEANKTKYLHNVVQLPKFGGPNMVLNGADMQYQNVQQDRNIYIDDSVVPTEPDLDKEWGYRHSRANEL